MNNLDWKFTITSKRTYKAIRDGWPIIINTGGARSGKTYGTMQNLVLLCHERPGLRVSVVSRSLPHIKKGAFRDFQQLLRQGIHRMGEMRWTDFTFHFFNGSYIEFFGLEDPEKAHGPGRDVLFINEANYVPKAVYDQLAMRTTGQILLDLNPSEFNCWVYQIADDPKNKNIHSTYKDNLANLSPQQVAFIEAYKDLPDPFMWQVYGLGLRGASEEIIYRGWELVDEMPGKGEIIHGLDFGFTNPSAFLQAELYEGAWYLDELIYEKGLTKPELNERIRGFNTGDKIIYADTAEPDSIEELYRMGLNIHPSNKDVWSGIVTVKSQRIYITRRSKNLITEIQGYKWKKDKNDLILEEPVKENDHLMDAMRYAIHTHLSSPKIDFWTV